MASNKIRGGSTRKRASHWFLQSRDPWPVLPLPVRVTHSRHSLTKHRTYMSELNSRVKGFQLLLQLEAPRGKPPVKHIVPMGKYIVAQ